MAQEISAFWAKTCKARMSWHPLILHMLDVAACAEAILAREPESTRKRMASILGMNWEDAKPWLLLIIACHDLGKACPGFQCKWHNLSGLNPGRNPNTDINHAFVSQLHLAEILVEKNWPIELAELVADATGSHHGSRASPSTLKNLRWDRRALGDSQWSELRNALVEALISVFQPGSTPVKHNLSGPEFMLLAGLTSFADWIGSNEDWFSFGSRKDCEDLFAWFDSRKFIAEKALDGIGWEPRTALSEVPKAFEQVFGLSPRPLQQATVEVLTNVNEPSVLLIEAPMGEGKTEAAFYSHLELQRRFGHRGLYVALPTKATGNAMFKRTLMFLQSQDMNRDLDLQLLHGGALLNDNFQKLKVRDIHDDKAGGEVRAAEWFTSKKRALLSEYGVGTVDQALLTILPVAHNFVRLWGLANRVIIFDEIHAYDAYTGTLLIQLLRWLLALGSSVVLLSATLSPASRRELARAVNATFPKPEQPYPRLSVFSPGQAVRQMYFGTDPERRLLINIKQVTADISNLRDSLAIHIDKGGLALALLNTVQRAQDLYLLFPNGKPIEREGERVGKVLPDGTEVYLFHARFPANRRQKREDQSLDIFGINDDRAGRKILIATQVVEQSLDLDFDFIISDLAPIDLVLQRAGRLWRHKQKNRATQEPTLIIAGLADDKPPSFDDPLWWGAVYREDVLLRSWCLLKEKRRITLPDEIDDLVQAVYEERVQIPNFLKERMSRAVKAEGDAIAERQKAHRAIIGLPDDASWDDPSRFTLYDEDDPGIHKTLMARTRLGDDSVLIIPLWEMDEFTPETIPDFNQSKTWFLRAINISCKQVVTKLRSQGIPPGWDRSSLLRNCYPMIFNKENCWEDDLAIRLDEELGLVFPLKETQ